MALAYGLDPRGRPEALYFRGPRDMVILGPCTRPGDTDPPARWTLTAQALKALAEIEPDHPLVRELATRRRSGPPVIAKGMGGPARPAELPAQRVVTMPDEIADGIGYAICPACTGSGRCPECDGAGDVDGLACATCDESGECPACGGKGKYRSDPRAKAAHELARSALETVKMNAAALRVVAQHVLGDDLR
jgi:hypothetical protein